MLAVTLHSCAVVGHLLTLLLMMSVLLSIRVDSASLCLIKCDGMLVLARQSVTRGILVSLGASDILVFSILVLDRFAMSFAPTILVTSFFHLFLGLLSHRLDLLLVVEAIGDLESDLLLHGA